MNIFDEYPVFCRVVNTERMRREKPWIANEPPIGTHGTVVGHILGPTTGEPRVIVLFDGRRYAVMKNPTAIRRLS